MCKVRTKHRCVNTKKHTSRNGVAFEQDFNTTVAMIQALIPIGLAAVEDLLQSEVTRVVGPRYGRQRSSKDLVRWGSQGGSVYLSDQKVKVQVPRIRNTKANTEVELPTYRKLQQPHAKDDSLLG